MEIVSRPGMLLWGPFQVLSHMLKNVSMTLMRGRTNLRVSGTILIGIELEPK